jgi:hypothetical protein
VGHVLQPYRVPLLEVHLTCLTFNNYLTLLSTNYVGYYNIATETINEGFGGDTACFPVI